MARRIAVIPARYASTRFPGKPLVPLLGKPMIQHVYDRCREAKCFDEVVIATDDERIANAARHFHAHVEMTSEECQSGTDRVGEVAHSSQFANAAVFFNIQGDEPAVAPASLRALVQAFDDPTVSMATLVRPLHDAERGNPNVVKVVIDFHFNALYFSRADIPFERQHSGVPRWAHLGLYGYRRDTLLALIDKEPTNLERTESLEQLRALQWGVRIACRQTEHESVAVDRPDDVAHAEEALRRLLHPLPK